MNYLKSHNHLQVQIDSRKLRPNPSHRSSMKSIQKIKDEHFKNITEIYSELLKFDQEANKKLEEIIKLSQQIEQIEKISHDYRNQLVQKRSSKQDEVEDLDEYLSEGTPQ